MSLHIYLYISFYCSPIVLVLIIPTLSRLNPVNPALLPPHLPWPAGGTICWKRELCAGQMCASLDGLDHPADLFSSALLHIPLQHDAYHAHHTACPLPVQVKTEEIMFPSLLV